jgi:glycosyltransferase involved in cell wall biosynthesis
VLEVRRDMRIALFSSYMPPHPGGQERHVSELARSLSDRGHEVTVVTSDLSGDPGMETDGIRIIWLPSVRLGSDALTRGLRGALREVRPDLVHIHTPISMISTQASLFRKGVPLVATYHGDFHKSTLGGNMLKKLRNHLQLPFVLRGARRVVVLTGSDRELLVSYGIDPGVISLVPPGLNLDGYGGEGIAPVEGRILYVGRVVYEKGMRELMEAFGTLARRMEHAELHVAGTGYAMEEMERLVERKGLGSRVHFLGWVEHERLKVMYGEAQVVVLPSFSEGMPYAMLEAMAAGRPVVCSDVSGMCELVRHGENGLLFDLQDPDALVDALGRLLGDPEACDRMGARARELCEERFSQERWVDDMERVYREAV